MAIITQVPPVPNSEDWIVNGKPSTAFINWLGSWDKKLREIAAFDEGVFLTQVTPQNLVDEFGVIIHQSNYWSSTATTTITAEVTPFDNTIPQITEGLELWSESITPKSTNSEIILHIVLSATMAGASSGTIHVHSSNQTDAIDAREVQVGGGIQKVLLTRIPSWGLTARTLSVRAGIGGTGGGISLAFNSGSLYGGTRHSVVFWEEREATPIS